jgi:methionine synthase I (cobalamin-dependent)
MANVYEWLDAGNTLVGDGAMGTALQDLGLTDGGAPELWNVDQPEKVASVLQGYAAAGANVLTTNTFGGTKGRLEMHDLGDRVFELNKAGSEVARSVADKFENIYGDFASSIYGMGKLAYDAGIQTRKSWDRRMMIGETNRRQNAIDGKSDWNNLPSQFDGNWDRPQ